MSGLEGCVKTGLFVILTRLFKISYGAFLTAWIFAYNVDLKSGNDDSHKNRFWSVHL